MKAKFYETLEEINKELKRNTTMLYIYLGLSIAFAALAMYVSLIAAVAVVLMLFMAGWYIIDMNKLDLIANIMANRVVLVNQDQTEDTEPPVMQQSPEEQKKEQDIMKLEEALKIMKGETDEPKQEQQVAEPVATTGRSKGNIKNKK